MRRLACFDRAAGSLLAARDSGEVRVVDREEVQETRRGLFGFTLPKLGIFGAGDDEQLELNDASRAARALAQARKPTRHFLSLASGGRAVIDIGFGEDLVICADVDRHDLVAEMRDQQITRAGG